VFFWVIRVVGWEEIEKSFFVLKGWQGLLILGLTVLAAMVGIWRWQQVLKGVEAGMPFKKLWGPYLAGFAIRYLAPVMIVGAEIFQGRALKDVYSVPWEKSMASVIVDRILDITANLVVIFFGVSFFLFKIGLPPTKLALILGLFLFILAGFIAYFYFKSVRRESMTKALARVFNSKLDTRPFEIEKEIFGFFKSRGRTMWFRTWILVLFLGKSLGVFPALSILAFYNIVIMIPIPADIGSHEAIQAFAFNSLGLGAGTGTAFALIVRGAELALAIFGTIILFHLGLELLKNVLFKKVEKIKIAENANNY
jgi:hypothetical protein